MDCAVVSEELKLALVENHLRLQLGKIISFKQLLSNGKTSHGKQYSESLAASHRQKYASLIHCFVQSQSQHNPRLLLILQEHIVYCVSMTQQIQAANPKNVLKAAMIILSVLDDSKERSTTCRPLVKPTQLSKTLLIQMCHRQLLYHRLVKTVQSQNGTT